MDRTFRITKKQLDEIINSDLLFSTDSTSPYSGSEVSTTEPYADENYGKPMQTDKHADNMMPSQYNRIGQRGVITPI